MSGKLKFNKSLNNSLNELNKLKFRKKVLREQLASPKLLFYLDKSHNSFDESMLLPYSLIFLTKSYSKVIYKVSNFMSVAMQFGT